MRIAIHSILLALALCFACTRSEPTPDVRALCRGLDDPATRAATIRQIAGAYTRMVRHGQTDESRAAARDFTHAVAPRLVATYRLTRDSPSDALATLHTLGQFHDSKALPAFIEACATERPGGEWQVLEATRAIREVDIIRDEQKPHIARALRAAFDRLRGDQPGDASRPSDEEIQREILETLAHLGPAGTAEVASIYRTDLAHASPDFIRRLALHLSYQAGEAEIPALIRGLFPRPSCILRPTTSLAIDGLTRIGDPAVEPLLRVVRLEDEEALEAAATGIAALSRLPGSNLDPLTPERVARSIALQALVELEAPAVIPYLLVDAHQGSERERLSALESLSRISMGRDIAELPMLIGEYIRSSPGDERAGGRADVLALALRGFVTGAIPLAIATASDRTEHVSVRTDTFAASATIASGNEAKSLRRVMQAEPRTAAGGLRELFERHAAILNLAIRCDTDTACWSRLEVNCPGDLREKCLTMLGRLGNSSTLPALVGALGSGSIEARTAALRSIDRLARSGSAAAVARIAELAGRPEGEDTRRFNPPALEVSRRLQLRASRIRAQARRP